MSAVEKINPTDHVHIGADSCRLSPAQWQAVLLHASTDAARGALHGVAVFKLDNGEHVLVATDSYRLIVFTNTMTSVEMHKQIVPVGKADPVMVAWIPRELIDSALAFYKASKMGKEPYPLLELNYPIAQWAPDGTCVTVGSNDWDHVGDMPDFPNWRNLIPYKLEIAAYDGHTPAFDPLKFETYAKIARLWKTSVPLRVLHCENELKPTLFGFDAHEDGNFLSLLMPVRVP